jgi:RNA polymerase sigma-70 factor (ECF subfamily)
MTEQDGLAQRFEEIRPHLRAVAYRMLGSPSEVEDAVQEAWIRLSRSDTREVENLGGWLTTVVARVCLDMLRSRASRREETLDAGIPEAIRAALAGADPEQETLLADSVGVALLVVLERLSPPERLAFVLHDMFAVPFEEIAAIVERSPAAARQLASRARRRVRGGTTPSGADLGGQRAVVDAFLAALRSGDFQGLLAVLDPGLLVRADHAAVPPGLPREVRGAEAWAKQALAFSRPIRFAHCALVDGAVGVVMAPGGKLWRVLTFAFADGKITEIEVITDPARLRELNLAVPEEGDPGSA